MRFLIGSRQSMPRFDHRSRNESWTRVEFARDIGLGAAPASRDRGESSNLSGSPALLTRDWGLLTFVFTRRRAIKGLCIALPDLND